MTPSEIFITIVVSIVANLMTPSVRAWGERLVIYAAVKLKSSSRKMAEVRLRQLQDESVAIETLHLRPIDLANRIASYTMPQVLSLWLIAVALLYALFSDNCTTLIHSGWSGVLFGFVGYATRYPIGSLFALNDLRKVTDIDDFREANSVAQAKIISLLEHHES